jgi:TetR/AcrR family transcriptional regulator, transcriptional repressor for nem operon
MQLAVVPQKLGELESAGAPVAQVRAYFDGLVRDLLSPEGPDGGRQGQPG